MYINSKNEQIDPTTMATPHLERALEKAKRENNAENIAVLESELANRE